MIYAGQTPAWIATMRDEAGLTGDNVMPKTRTAMVQLLEKKNKPMLNLLRNKKYNPLQKKMTFDYPLVSATSPKLVVCWSESTGKWKGDEGEQDFSRYLELLSGWLPEQFPPLNWVNIFISF